MRPRVPVAYAGLLVIALVAVIGFAAFSPSGGPADIAPTTTGVEASAAAAPMSARVASAVLAIRVTNAGTRTATTQPVVTTSTEAEPTDVPDAENDAAATQTTTAAVAETTTTQLAAAPQSAPADTTPPSFTITSPHDGHTVDSTFVEFKGTVENGATVRSGPYEAAVNDDGTWSLSLAVVAGENGASFTATDSAGNTSSARIVVNYSPPETTTTNAPATTTTTQAPTSTATTTTTTAPSSSSPKWSPNWPADAGGIRDVEAWRPLVEQYWAADRVDCVLGIILTESRGDPRAYNSASGASGLMQHLIKYWPGRAASAGFKDSDGLVASPYNGEANIAAGAVIAGSGDNWYAPWGHLTTYGSCSG
ncbi:MAG: hypothetical protein ABFR53_03430 [Actinomycetota bacterium]